jgi:hypothetical protein
VDIKETFKGLLISLIGTTLVLCLFFIVYGLVFNQITSDRNEIKSILTQSNLYEKLPPAIYDSSAENNNRQTFAPLDDPQVREIALDTFTPAVAQNNIENLIDGTYDWLEGKTNQPEFVLDVKDTKDQFANRVGDYAKEKSTSLPDCSFSQLQKIQNSEEFNIFTANCVPPFISPQVIDQQTASAIKQSDEVLGDGTLKASELENARGEPLFKNLDNIPDTFSAVKFTPLILLAFSSLLIFALLKVSKNKTEGLKRVSRWVGLAGVLIFLTPIAFMIMSRTLLYGLGNQPEFRDIAISVLEQYVGKAGEIYYLFGLVLVVLAISLHIFTRKNTRLEEKVK